MLASDRRGNGALLCMQRQVYLVSQHRRGGNRVDASPHQDRAHRVMESMEGQGWLVEPVLCLLESACHPKVRTATSWWTTATKSRDRYAGILPVVRELGSVRC
jgi:hypothetical protein